MAQPAALLAFTWVKVTTCIGVLVNHFQGIGDFAIILDDELATQGCDREWVHSTPSAQ